ncbi:Hypothetical predicted protein [Mytilus galloprovincialis]|uniref:Uncharacterized protein n=1 Tax=Mytilus galloprovincialis TaxID=29158 RepID=A0A8B6D781_MYTGA|nr:Hypothetical predicted protein [Mytilus galloprovincialis]
MGIFWKRLLKKGEDSCFLIIKELTTNHHSDFFETITSDNESIPRPVHIGNTQLRLGSTSVIPTQTYLLGLQSQAQGIGNFNDVINANERIQSILQETINTDVLEIREGSIYFHLNSFSPDILLSILNGHGDDKIKLCLTSLFQSSSLVKYFAKNTVIEFMLKEIPEDTFITDGKKTQLHEKKMVKEFCTACYQTTLRQNRETIIGEIEDDIIEDTMNEVKEMRRDTMLKSTECFSGYKSRRRKAIAFLQYVLCNEDVLLAFEMAFTFRSQVHMDIIKCRKCEDRNGTNLQKPELRSRKCYFTVSLDDIGRVCINDVTKNVSLPSHVFRNLSDQPSVQRMRDQYEVCNGYFIAPTP